MTQSALFTPLALPCGAIIPNRLGKAAMEENMKKIFMKGIFAMNMEAYNVLGDQPNNSMESEIEKQIKLAMEVNHSPQSS